MKQNSESQSRHLRYRAPSSHLHRQPLAPHPGHMRCHPPSRNCKDIGCPSPPFVQQGVMLLLPFFGPRIWRGVMLAASWSPKAEIHRLILARSSPFRLRRESTTARYSAPISRKGIAFALSKYFPSRCSAFNLPYKTFAWLLVSQRNERSLPFRKRRTHQPSLPLRCRMPRSLPPLLAIVGLSLS